MKHVRKIAFRMVNSDMHIEITWKMTCGNFIPGKQLINEVFLYFLLPSLK